MSDLAVKKLDVIDTIKDGVGIGVKNIGPILVNCLLWALTCWIPYLNVGTTIGLFVGIVSKASKSEAIPMSEIFDPKYRKYMGEFFITLGLIGIGVGAGLALVIIPGCVIALAWSLALLIVIDKGRNPTEAMSLSNKCTYGNKWRMVGIYLLANIAASIVYGIIGAVFYRIPFLCFLLMFAASVFIMSIFIGLQASIYKQLSEGV